MLLKEWMEENYRGLPLTAQLWKQWPFSQQVDLAKGEYQFLEDGQYNEVMFEQAKNEAISIINQLFSKNQTIILVASTYFESPQERRRPFTHKILKTKKDVSFSGQLIRQSKSEDGWLDQVVLTTNYQNIRWDSLLACLLNQDFPDRNPRFTKYGGWNYPAIYLIEPKTCIILHVYDDRGYELYFPNEQIQEWFQTRDLYL